jgi:hypothetical protein
MAHHFILLKNTNHAFPSPTYKVSIGLACHIPLLLQKILFILYIYIYIFIYFLICFFHFPNE